MLTSKLGALYTHLAPTAIALASYFCFADCILISQCVYYNTINSRRRAAAATADEQSPLLPDGRRNRRRSDSFGLPGSHRRRATHTETSMEPIRKVLTGEDETRDSKPWTHNALSLLAVYTVGFSGWFVSYKMGAWDGPDPSAGNPDADAVVAVGKSASESFGLALGYVSAVCYLW